MQQTTMTPSIHLKSGPSKHSISGLFIFVLIAAYAVFSLMLVLIGVRAYQNVVQSADRNSELRTTIGYISGRIRGSDGAVSLRAEGDYTVLRIGHALGEQDYETRIYFAPIEDADYGGLYEQVVDTTEEFDWEMGELICEIGQFDMSLDGDMLLLELATKAGERHSMHIRLLDFHNQPEGGESA